MHRAAVLPCHIVYNQIEAAVLTTDIIEEFVNQQVPDANVARLFVLFGLFAELLVFSRFVHIMEFHCKVLSVKAQFLYVFSIFHIGKKCLEFLLDPVHCLRQSFCFFVHEVDSWHLFEEFEHDLSRLIFWVVIVHGGKGQTNFLFLSFDARGEETG